MLHLFLSWLMPLAMAAGIVERFIGEDQENNLIAMAMLPVLTIVFRESMKQVFGNTLTVKMVGFGVRENNKEEEHD